MLTLELVSKAQARAFSVCPGIPMVQAQDVAPFDVASFALKLYYYYDESLQLLIFSSPRGVFLGLPMHFSLSLEGEEDQR